MPQQTRKYYIKKLILLGLPVSAGQIGHVITGFADTIMVGHLGKDPLAAAGLANALFFIAFIFGMGLLGGITPLVGASDARGNEEQCKRLLRHGMLFAILAAIILTGLNIVLGKLLPHMGQETAVVIEAIPYYYWITASMAPAMLFSGLKNYFEGLGLTTPPMIASLFSNLLNVVLNYIFIFGKLGFEPMGLSGAGLATFIARIAMFISILIYGFYNTRVKGHFKEILKLHFHTETFNTLTRVGLPIGFQYFIEVGAFAMGAIMAGWVNSATQAAHQIVIQLCALTYLVASGISTAGTIVISNLFGVKNYKELRFVGHTAFYMVTAIMSVTAVIFALGNSWLPTLFNKDPEVIGVAAGLLFIGALFQLFDGFQSAAISALRGITDVRIPTYLAVLAYWSIGIPSGYLLAFHFHMGGRGIWWGYLIGLATAAILLFTRFQFITAKMIREE